LEDKKENKKIVPKKVEKLKEKVIVEIDKKDTSEDEVDGLLRMLLILDSVEGSVDGSVEDTKQMPPELEDNLLKAKESVIDKQYLYYLSKGLKEQFRRYATGMKVYRFKIQDFKFIKVDVPALETQKKIIEIIKPLEDSIMNIKNQINETKKLLINEYNLLDTSRNFLQDYIKNHTRKYSGQTKYLATNAIGEFSIDSHKAQDISNQKPSRANLTPENNSIIVSKLDGENKMMYIDDAFKYVVSTGFFNFSTNHLDHLVGFLLSNDFKKQKSMLSTGTTMVGLNNSGLKRIKISSPINKNNTLTNHLNRLILTEIKLSKQKDKIINLLIK
jgi:type I restriction enzyme S subunit